MEKRRAEHVTQVSVGQQVVPVAQLRCARSCRKGGACRKQRVPQVPYRSYVRRLGPEPSHEGQGAVRRQSSGANNVDHPEARTVRGVVERRERNREKLWRVRDRKGARRHPHRFNRRAAPKGERQAARTTEGDCGWLEGAKGSQRDKGSEVDTRQ